MKILFWTDGFWPRLGGIETQNFEFIQEMQKRGHEYRVVSQKDFPSWLDEEIVNGIQINRFDFNSIIKTNNIKILHFIKKYIQTILIQFKPNIIHLNTTVGGSLFAFLLFKSFFSVPVILTAYSPYLYLGHFSPIVKQALDSVDQVCCISNWVLKAIEPYLSLMKSKLQRIYCGLPVSKIEPTPLSFSPPTLLIFGRLSWEKGFDTMIRAFALLKKNGSRAQLIVGGDGIQKPALEKLVMDLNLTDSVKFTGVLTREEVLTIFNQATLVIVPSIHESFGLVILEAMQLGRPVIASRVEGIPEVVADGETGLLVPPKDPEALSQAIQNLLNNPDKAIMMGINGKKRASQFTLHQYANEYEEIYSLHLNKENS